MHSNWQLARQPLRITLLAAGLIVASLAMPGQAGATTAVPGQPAPDFVLKDPAGRNIRLSEWRGDTVILTFWASWCGHCVDQLPVLDNLTKQYASRGVRVVAINIDKDAQASAEAGRRYTLAVLHDAGNVVARAYDLADLPLTVLVDPHGTVRFVHEKYRGGDAALYAEELAQLVRE